MACPLHIIIHPNHHIFESIAAHIFTEYFHHSPYSKYLQIPPNLSCYYLHTLCSLAVLRDRAVSTLAVRRSLDITPPLYLHAVLEIYMREIDRLRLSDGIATRLNSLAFDRRSLEIWSFAEMGGVLEEGEPVDTACSGATTSGIGAMTSGACKSTLVEGFNVDSSKQWCETTNPVRSSKVVPHGVEERGFGTESEHDRYRSLL
ncbi:hypothetical protein Tco_0653689 [Tanacetum coccineum]|uniref:Uncharacterized protein n=1 Tax=Tanacetum coccineum TaxID=301880 RepID=A0ABQ4X1A0_9ASTR